MSDLRRRAVDALVWAYTATALRLGIQLVSGVLLARLLGPRPFGMIAAAWVFVGVAGQFVDCGFGSVLVQRAQLDARQIRFAFTLQLLLGLGLSGAMCLASGWLARWTGNPAMAGVIAALSLALLLQALGQTAASLLRRTLDLGTLQLAQLGGTLAGYGAVALPMALLGYGVRSLVAGQLTQSLVTTVITYAKVRHPVAPLLTREGGTLLRFGVKVTATNLVNWLIAGLDSLAMTRYFGPVATGWFNRAQVLALAPGGQVGQGLQSVLFPAYSRRAEYPAILRQVYLASLGSLSLVLLPAGVVLAVTAGTVVRALYGAAWAPAAGLLVPLALAMPVHCGMALHGPLLWAKDRVSDELRVQSGVAVLFAIMLMAAGRMTPAALAWAVLLVYVVRCAAMMGRTLAVCGGRWSECLRALRGPAVLALAAAAVAAWVNSLSAGWGPGVRLIFVLLATALPITGLAVTCFGWLLPADTRALLRSCRERLRLPEVAGAFAHHPPEQEAWGGAL